MQERQMLAISGAILIFSLFVSGIILKPEKVRGIVEQTESYVAGAFFKESVDDRELIKRYETFKEKNLKKDLSNRRRGLPLDGIKVLIVPGHDDESFGAMYNDLKEVELNRLLASNLYNYLEKEPGFEVMLASTDEGYHKKLLKYFEKEREDILNFKSEYQLLMNEFVQKGKVDIKDGVFHNSAPSEVALKLYGINKWVNEEEFDIVIHIHFNDYPRRDEEKKYNGFSMYIPERQYSNGRASMVFAKHLFDQLDNHIPRSNNPVEKDGIIEDQELIAIGAYNTVDAISILMEYGYIYENQYQDEDLRKVLMKELAFQTFKGIKSFFNEKDEKETTLINGELLKEDISFDSSSLSVLSLQAFLNLNNNYPPKNETLNNCPITGFFGECTRKALKEFQSDNNLLISGRYDKKTKEHVLDRVK